MLRKIIKIDAEKCVGCKLCVDACREGAIGMVDGKAKLLREDYCDGLGNCLPVCPTGAITFEERETSACEAETLPCGCPGTHSKTIDRENSPAVTVVAESELRQWPIQIKLVPMNAPYFKGAKLLIAADCAAYARANFHAEYMRGRVTLIGCPKLDAVDYSEKLTEIIRQNDIKSVTVVRMEVPCCSGIEQAVTMALKNSGKHIPWQVVTFGTDGSVREV